MIMVFRRHESSQAGFILNDLKEIDRNAEYELTQYFTYEPSEPIRMKGSEFLEFKIEINECPGSVIIEYKKK